MQVYDSELNIHLKCDKASLQRSYRPPFALVCPFYIQIRDTFFPSKTWDDFVVPILTEWLGQVISVEVPEKNGIELHFMEGSYFMRIIPQEKKVVKILLVSVRKSSELIIEETIVKLEYLRNSIYQVSKILANEISKAGIQGQDYSQLENIIASYETIHKVEL